MVCGGFQGNFEPEVLVAVAFRRFAEPGRVHLALLGFRAVDDRLVHAENVIGQRRVRHVAEAQVAESRLDTVGLRRIQNFPFGHVCKLELALSLGLCQFHRLPAFARDFHSADVGRADTHQLGVEPALVVFLDLIQGLGNQVHVLASVR